MNFPTFENWCEEVLHPQDTHPWNFRTEQFYEEYRTKYAIAKLVKPQRILEIGVRFGYSARSFLLAAPDAAYLGLDIDEPSYGPCKCIPREWAEKRLKKLYPKNNIHTAHVDTQRAIFDFDEPFDLIHIDGDHSYKGALHDFQQFWPACENTMVIDDYHEVQTAVDTFMRQIKDEAVKFIAESFRGSALLVRIFKK